MNIEGDRETHRHEPFKFAPSTPVPLYPCTPRPPATARAQRESTPGITGRALPGRPWCCGGRGPMGGKGRCSG